MTHVLQNVSAALAIVYGAVSGQIIARDIVAGATPPAIEGDGYAISSGVPGEPILVSWTLQKRTECPGTNSRVWDGPDGFHITEAAKPTSLPATNDPKTYIIPTEIPELAPPGELSLSIVGWFQCNGGERENFRIGPVIITVLE